MNKLVQISDVADRELNKLSARIGKDDEEIELATEDKNKAWEEVFNYFSEFNTEGRFIAADGHTLTRQERQGSPKLDEEKLMFMLKAKLTPRQFTIIWNKITEQKVSSTKLEHAIQAGLVPHELVDECITVPPVTYARVRRNWTKEDKERARIFGIEESD